MSHLVEIRSLTKTYVRGREKIEVLHGINLDIPRGDFVALMGPSGSGKTTLLNLIGGLDTPTTGSIRVDGQRIDQLSSGELSRWRAAHVGFVFQFYNLLPVLSAQRNVELPLLLTNLSAAQRRSLLRPCFHRQGGARMVPKGARPLRAPAGEHGAPSRSIHACRPSHRRWCPSSYPRAPTKAGP